MIWQVTFDIDVKGRPSGIVFRTELEDEDDRIAGSTATVAMVRGDKIIVANVGDSRAVLCRQGMPVDLTTEHRRVSRSMRWTPASLCPQCIRIFHNNSPHLASQRALSV